MKSIGGLILIVFGALWVVAALMAFVASSIGPEAIELLAGAIFISIGQKLRSKPSENEDVESDG